MTTNTTPNTPINQQVWLITGASSGIGAAIAAAALRAGHLVAATARNVDALALEPNHEAEYLPLRLDVTDAASIDAAVAATIERFGRIDVLVNNAGYGMHGYVEEVVLDDARALFETNFFGLIAVTQAVLPQLRRQRDGLIVQVTSIASTTSIPGGGVYAASKHAVDGLSKALRQEVAEFGVRVLCVEPGPFRTEFTGRSLAWQDPNLEYDQSAREQRVAMHGTQTGDPERLAAVLVEQAQRADLPVHLVFGKVGHERMHAALTERIEQLTAHTEGLNTDFT